MIMLPENLKYIISKYLKHNMEKKVIKKPIKKIQKESFVDKLKKNWKTIVIVLLLLFSINKCTNSCTRGREIDRLNYQIVQQDSALRANNVQIDKLSTRLDDANTSINNYKGIATGNQKDLINKLEELTENNKNLNTKVNNLTKENKNLTKENEKLTKENTELKEENRMLREDYVLVE